MAFADMLNTIGASIVDPLLSIWYWLVKAIPDVIAAFVILLVGYLVALAVQYVIEKVLDRANFDEWMFKRTNLSSVVGKFALTHFLGVIAKWYVIVLFLSATAARVELGAVSAFLSALAGWIPIVIAAVIIGLIGVAAALYVEKKVIATRARYAKIIAMVAKWVIYVFTALIALDQIGVKIAIAQNTFMIILGGVVLAIGLMLGISFGLGFKDEAKGIIKDIKRKL